MGGARSSLHTATGVTLPTSSCRREPRRPWAAGFLLLVSAVLVWGCASSTATRRPAGADVNLSGFPPGFKQGYADGCASVKGPRVRDETRYRGEPQYASGWRDGFDICRRK